MNFKGFEDNEHCQEFIERFKESDIFWENRYILKIVNLNWRSLLSSTQFINPKVSLVSHINIEWPSGQLDIKSQNKLERTTIYQFYY